MNRVVFLLGIVFTGTAVASSPPSSGFDIGCTATLIANQMPVAGNNPQSGDANVVGTFGLVKGDLRQPLTANFSLHGLVSAEEEGTD